VGHYNLAIPVIALFVVGLLFVRIEKEKKPVKMSNLAKVAFFLVLAGILLGDNPYLGYTVIGGGVALALVDIANRIRNR